MCRQFPWGMINLFYINTGCFTVCLLYFFQHKQSYLHEVHFCFDVDRNLIDCNLEKLDISCFKDECILFPSLDKNVILED